MGELETTRTEVALPDGTLVDLTDPAQCAWALLYIRDLESRLREFKGAFTDAIVEHSQKVGSKTLHLGEQKVEVKGGEKVVWDAQQLEEDLRAAGMPEKRIREIVVEEVSYTVQAVEAKKAARANPVYDEAVGRARQPVETRPTISITRG
jgi:hypothetical protein